MASHALAANARFGSEGDPRVCNLHRGSPAVVTVADPSRTRPRVCDESDDEWGGSEGKAKEPPMKFSPSCPHLDHH